jgi:hypothetical protein
MAMVISLLPAPYDLTEILHISVTLYNLCSYSMRRMAAGDQFPPAAQRGDWHNRPPFRVSFSATLLCQEREVIVSQCIYLLLYIYILQDIDYMVLTQQRRRERRP